jgi:hypothetical protein
MSAEIDAQIGLNISVGVPKLVYGVQPVHFSKFRMSRHQPSLPVSERIWNFSYSFMEHVPHTHSRVRRLSPHTHLQDRQLLGLGWKIADVPPS